MLTFQYPWIFFLLPLPLLAYWAIPRGKRQQAAVRVPFYRELSGLSPTANATLGKRKLRLGTLTLIWLCLLAACANPIWWGKPVTLPTSGRDILLDVDLSGSMKIRDMKVGDSYVTRIDAVKAVLDDFIKRRKGDRLGLVLFGTRAYVQTPLTFDRKTVSQFMHEAQIGFAGAEQTAIGDAIGLSVKRLRKRPGDRHVMVLLTDGANNGGEVKPIPAAKLAAQYHIVIYTIGIGADEMVVPGPFGGMFGSQRVNPSRDLDEKTLREIAAITGGRYFRARDPKQLQKIYKLLDQLEPVKDNNKTYRPQKSMFYWPLAVAALASVLIALSVLPLRRWLPSASNAGNHADGGKW